MATYHSPKRATAYKFYVGLVDQSNTKLLKANPTLAAGDVKVSKDGGAFANLTTLPSANPASGAANMALGLIAKRPLISLGVAGAIAAFLFTRGGAK